MASKMMTCVYLSQLSLHNYRCYVRREGQIFSQKLCLSSFTLNTINLFYFCREEITSAMRESVKMVERGEISQQDIDVQLLGKTD